MRAQLLEAVAALNRLGIVPLLLKGAVPLFLSQANQIPVRMTSDLDLSVDAADEAGAQQCLGELGYLPLPDARGMARPQDVGVLELRLKLRKARFGSRRSSNGITSARTFRPRRPVPYIGSSTTSSKKATIGAGELTYGTYMISRSWRKATMWTGRRCGWPCRTKAAVTPLMHSSSPCTISFGMTIPLGTTQSPMVRFQHWRRMFTARHPVIGAPVRLAGNLAWGAWRVSQANGLVQRGPIDLARRMVRTLFESDRRAKIYNSSHLNLPALLQRFSGCGLLGDRAFTNKNVAVPLKNNRPISKDTWSPSQIVARFHPC